MNLLYYRLLVALDYMIFAHDSDSLNLRVPYLPEVISQRLPHSRTLDATVAGVRTYWEVHCR